MISAIKTPWQKPIKVIPKENYRLDIIMEDQQSIELDLLPLISNREAFWRLKNIKYFQQVSIDELGGLCWAEGEDISPTKLLSYAIN